MKKIVKAVACIAAFVLVLAFTAGCDLTRKLGGAEASFPGKVSGAETLSFKMDVAYAKGDTTTNITMMCYKRDAANGAEEYAYVYSAPGALYDSYKNIYADNKLYEMINFTKNTGIYYVKQGVPVSDEGNMLYSVKQNILLTSVAAFLTKAKKETLNGKTAYRYDVTLSGKKVSLWYNDEALVKFYVKFDGENGADAEEYTLSLSEYRFNEALPADVFVKPSDQEIGYIESPLSFESWMGIISGFAAKLGA